MTDDQRRKDDEEQEIGWRPIEEWVVGVMNPANKFFEIEEISVMQWPEASDEPQGQSSK